MEARYVEVNATTEWKCDFCRDPILDGGDGCAEWLDAKYPSIGGPRAKGLRLMHASHSSPRLHRKDRCQYDRVLYDSSCSGYTVKHMALARMTGPDGLQVLLRLLSEGGLPKDEVLEMIRRLHVPGYEHARLHFGEAKDTGVITEDQKPDLCEQDAIERILNHTPHFDDCELCLFLGP